MHESFSHMSHEPEPDGRWVKHCPAALALRLKLTWLDGGSYVLFILAFPPFTIAFLVLPVFILITVVILPLPLIHMLDTTTV